jgi:cytochrome b involved in lipid metabolism
LTRSEVAQHDSASDCWTIIDGSVYDLTSYIPRHPGGDDILEACGTDGSSLFNQRQTDDGQSVGSGTPHSGNAKSQLQSLFVGQLAN